MSDINHVKDDRIKRRFFTVKLVKCLLRPQVLLSLELLSQDNFQNNYRQKIKIVRKKVINRPYEDI